MKDFKKIFKDYSKIDKLLAREGASVNSRFQAEWEKIQKTNDEAYFILLFAQFESFVENRCQKLVDKKNSLTDWKKKRPWDSLSDLKSIPFMKKVGFLTEKGQTTYNTISGYYKIRCEIAHGKRPKSLPILYFVEKQLLTISKKFMV